MRYQISLPRKIYQATSPSNEIKYPGIQGNYFSYQKNFLRCSISKCLVKLPHLHYTDSDTTHICTTDLSLYQISYERQRYLTKSSINQIWYTWTRGNYFSYGNHVSGCSNSKCLSKLCHLHFYDNHDLNRWLLVSYQIFLLSRQRYLVTSSLNQIKYPVQTLNIWLICFTWISDTTRNYATVLALYQISLQR